MSIAYWISPKGEIIEIKKGSHIAEVIAFPEKFGLIKEFIEHVYNFYGEKIGQEGKAREQIMISLLNQNWIRIRKYKQFWSINVNRLSGKIKTFVYEWAKKILKGIHGYKEDDPYAAVKIDQKGKKVKTTDLKTIAETEKFISEHILIEKTTKELPNLDPYVIVTEMLTGELKLPVHIKYI